MARGREGSAARARCADVSARRAERRRARSRLQVLSRSAVHTLYIYSARIPPACIYIRVLCLCIPSPRERVCVKPPPPRAQHDRRPVPRNAAVSVGGHRRVSVVPTGAAPGQSLRSLHVSRHATYAIVYVVTPGAQLFEEARFFSLRVILFF